MAFGEEQQRFLDQAFGRNHSEDLVKPLNDIANFLQPMSERYTRETKRLDAVVHLLGATVGKEITLRSIYGEFVGSVLRISKSTVYFLRHDKTLEAMPIESVRSVALPMSTEDFHLLGLENDEGPKRPEPEIEEGTKGPGWLHDFFDWE